MPLVAPMKQTTAQGWRMSKQQYMQRCEQDVGFFCRHEVHIRPKKKSPTGLVTLSPNPPQQIVLDEIAALESAKKPIRLLILKARQWGASTVIQAYVMHRSRFRPYHDALVIGNRDQTTKNLMAMNRRMYENFSPAVLEGWDRKISQTDKNYEWENGSVLQIDTAGQPEAARSSTRDLIHGTESAFWPNGGSVLDAMLPGVPDTPGSCVILETTSNGPAGIFWELWEGSKDDQFSEWRRIFVPWNINPEYQDVLDPDLADLGARASQGDQSALDEIGWLDEKEKEWLLTGELTLNQVHWRKRIVATKFKGREEKFCREYPFSEEEAFEAAGGGYLNESGMKHQKLSETTDITRYDVTIEGEPMGVTPLVLTDFDSRPLPEQCDNGWIEVLELPEPGQVYVMGVDPSEGTGNDYASFVIRCSDRVVCVGYRNDISTDVFGEYLYCTGTWYNNATIHCERAGGGMAVINTLLRLNYPSMYATESFDESGVNTGKRIGFQPTRDNVRNLLSMFRHTVNEGHFLMCHPRLIQEATWVRLLAKTGMNGETNYDWRCPGKGRKSVTGDRVSDDMFRAAALTEPVVRDREWIQAVEQDMVEVSNPDLIIRESKKELEYNNPWFEGEGDRFLPGEFSQMAKGGYDPFEVLPEEVDDDWKLPLP